MKKIVILMLFMAFSTVIVHAQDVQISAEYKEIANISRQKDGKYCLTDHDNKPIIADADTIFTISDVFYYIIKNGKHGIYFMSGEPCIPIEYDNIEHIYKDYWHITKDGKAGLCRSNGRQVLPTNYKKISVIRRKESDKYDFFIVKKDKYGLCDDNGKPILPTQYDKIQYRDGYWALEKASATDYLLNDEHLVKGITISKYEIPFLHRENDKNKKYYSFKKGNLWGIIDEDGHTRIKAQYENRLQLTSYEDENTPIFFIAHDNGNFGIVDLNNKIILPIKYGGILRTAFKDIIEVETAQGYQLFSLRSKRIITSFYDENSKSDSNYLYLHKEPFVTPFDPRKEQTLLPWEYKRVQNIEGSDNFIAQKEGRYGVVNSRNEALVPFIYDNIKSTLKPNMLIIEKERKYGIIDTSNKLLYGMTDNAIESRRNYFEIKDYSKPLNPRLDYELKPIPDPR